MPGASVSDVPSPHLPPPPQLTVLSEERAALLELWELRRQQYEQCMDLQLFYRATEQVDNWMSKQEVSGVGGRPPVPCCSAGPFCAGSVLHHVEGGVAGFHGPCQHHSCC